MMKPSTSLLLHSVLGLLTISVALVAKGEASSGPIRFTGTDPLATTPSSSNSRAPFSARANNPDSSCSRLIQWVFQDNGAHSPARQCGEVFGLNISATSSSSLLSPDDSKTDNNDNISTASCLALAQDEIQPETDKYGYWDIYYSCNGTGMPPAIMYGPSAAGGCVFGMLGIDREDGIMRQDVAMAPTDVLTFVRQAVGAVEAGGSGGMMGVVTGKARCAVTGETESGSDAGQTVVWWVGSGGRRGAVPLGKEWWYWWVMVGVTCAYCGGGFGWGDG